MDTSNSAVDYVLRGKRVEISELSPKDWLQVVETLISKLRPYLSHLPYIDGHGAPLSRRIFVVTQGAHVAKYEEEPSSICYDLAGEIGSRTRLLPLAVLYAWSVLARPEGWKHNEVPWDGNTLEEDHLLYNPKSGWVRLRRSLRRVHNQSTSKGVRVVSHTFALLTSHEVLESIGNRPERWAMVFRSFRDLLKQAIDQKEMHAREMRHVLDFTEEIEGRVRLPLPPLSGGL